MVQDLVGDASHQDRRHRPLAPATDDDQVGLELVRGPDDLVGGLAAADDGVHLRSRVPELLRDSFHSRSCRPLERVGPWVARPLGGAAFSSSPKSLANGTAARGRTTAITVIRSSEAGSRSPSRYRAALSDCSEPSVATDRSTRGCYGLKHGKRSVEEEAGEGFVGYVARVWLAIRHAPMLPVLRA
jgi:hypothetical protein